MELCLESLATSTKSKSSQPAHLLISSAAKPAHDLKSSKHCGKHIDDEELKGESGDGVTVTYKKKSGGTGKAKGGQVIHCGECPLMKKFCGGKSKVAMFELATFHRKALG